MAIFMFVISVLVFLAAAAASMAAKSSIHEIYSAVLGVISAVFWIGAAIVDAMNKNRMAILQYQIKQNYQTPGPGIKTKACHYCDAEIRADFAICPKCGKTL